ncbi:MAG: TetR family transcriptional regulator [Longimicrobiales bacterium]|nr:TetR family transcriptional regulator [Longimicrobiales bacterium]
MSESDLDTEDRILEAARSVFLRRGTTGARMREIAEEAGVNQALLHYYFRTKEALAEAVFRKVARQLLPPIVAELRSDHPLAEKAKRVIELELDHLSRNPNLPAYLISELSHHPDRAPQLWEEVVGEPADRSGGRVLEKLREQLDEAAEREEVRPLEPEQFLVNLVSLCIFPFAARPMLEAVLGLGPNEFEAFIEERRQSLPDFFLGALAP